MKRLLAFLLTLLMLLPLFTACSARRLTVIDDGKCFVLYDPTTVSASTLRLLTDAIEEITGVPVDAEYEGVAEKGTILLGNVLLDGYRSPVSALRDQDFFVGIDADYYLIGGITEEATQQAIEYFIETVLPAIENDQKLIVRKRDNYVSEGSYRLEGVTIGGVGLDAFSIITVDSPSVSEFRTAVLLQEHIRQFTGYLPRILTESETCPTEGKILIGDQLCEVDLADPNDYSITVIGKTMKVAAASMLGFEAVQKALRDQVFNARNATLQMGDGFSVSGNGAENATASLEAEGDLRLMFSNIHGYPTTDDGPTPVKEASQQLAELYLTYLPDVLGTQEFSPNSYSAGLDRMIASEYEAVSVSTGGNYKTYTALFYRKSTMELLASGYLGFNTLSYNEYPDLLSGYSASTVKSACADNSKGVTWGIFRVKQTGQLILVASTHLWWKSGDVNEIARRVQLMAMREYLVEQASAFATANQLTTALPIFVGGDYNTSRSRSNTALTVMESAGNTFHNANDIAKTKLTSTTHHGYATFDTELGIYVDPQYSSGKFNAAIDHIYTNAAASSSVKVERVGILSDQYAHLSSDHNPVYTDISFTATAPKLNP